MSDAPPRRVEGRVYLHPRSPGIVTKPDLFIPDHQRVRFPIVLPTGPFIRPTDTDDLSGRAQLPAVPTPIDPFQSRRNYCKFVRECEIRNACQFSDCNYGDSANPSDDDNNDDLLPEDYCGTSTAADSANSGKSTAAAIGPSSTSVFATPECDATRG